MHYLIFDRYAHSVVTFVRAEGVAEAMVSYIANDDPSFNSGDDPTEHPLAYIESVYKTTREWQIRALPEWAWQDAFVEAFCGEEVAGGPSEVIDDCRTVFARDFPRRRARAFVWYLRSGILVTFYQKGRRSRIDVLRRYLWSLEGDGHVIQAWNGDYDEIIDALRLEPPRVRPGSPERVHLPLGSLGSL